MAIVQSLQDTASPLLLCSANSTRATFDEFALYNDALSAAQVVEHFKTGSGAEAG